MPLERKDASIRTLGVRHRRALGQMHPELLARVSGLLAELGGQFMIWEGYRGKEAQQAALAAGRSLARFGQSPHNFDPCYAVDVVLNPAIVDDLEPHPQDARYPNLWMKTHPAWKKLERMAIRHHLKRVDIHGERDLPHLELPGWWDMAMRGRRVL